MAAGNGCGKQVSGAIKLTCLAQFGSRNPEPIHANRQLSSGIRFIQRLTARAFQARCRSLDRGFERSLEIVADGSPQALGFKDLPRETDIFAVGHNRCRSGRLRRCDCRCGRANWRGSGLISGNASAGIGNLKLATTHATATHATSLAQAAAHATAAHAAAGLKWIDPTSGVHFQHKIGNGIDLDDDMFSRLFFCCD